MAAGLAGRDRRHLRWLLLGLALSGVIAAVVNLVHVVPLQLAHHIDVANPPVAIYQSANQEALYLVPLAAVALAYLLFSSERVERRVAAAFLVVTVPAILLTYSRGGLVALAVAAVIVVLFHPRRWVIVLPLLVALAAAVAALPGIRRRLAVELDPASPDNTLHSRLGLWQGTLRMLEHRPVFGAGLRGFDRDVEPYYHDPFKVAFPHDLALNFWSETGLLGLAAFTWLSIAAVVSAARTRGLPLSIGLIGFLAALWVHGLVDVPYLKNDLAVAFWAVLGLHAASVEAA